MQNKSKQVACREGCRYERERSAEPVGVCCKPVLARQHVGTLVCGHPPHQQEGGVARQQRVGCEARGVSAMLQGCCNVV